MKVANPILQPVTFVIPWANTVHGLTPTPAAIIKASPKPKRIRPITRKTTDTKGGAIISALGELQNRFGTFFIDRNLIELTALIVIKFFNTGRFLGLDFFISRLRRKQGEPEIIGKLFIKPFSDLQTAIDQALEEKGKEFQEKLEHFNSY